MEAKNLPEDVLLLPVGFTAVVKDEIDYVDYTDAMEWIPCPKTKERGLFSHRLRSFVSISNDCRL